MKKNFRCFLSLILMLTMVISVCPREVHATQQKDSLRILTIGNSHSLDSTRLLAKVFEVHDPDREVILGTMYYSGCTMSQHVNYATNNKAVYSYNKNVDGVWSSIKESTLLTALEDENWDIVVLQEMNNQAAMQTSFQNDNINKLMNYVKSHQETEPVFYWNMVWANPTDPTFWDPDYDVQPPGNWIQNYETRFLTDQILMYELITANAEKYVASNPAIEQIFPSGTVVQYANHLLGQTDLDLYRDYTHISDFARLMVAYLWYTKITGESLNQIKVDVVPKVLRHSRFQKYGDLTVTDEMKQVILDSVQYAVENPYQVPDPPVTAVRCAQCRTEPQWTPWDGSPMKAGDGHYYLTKDVSAAESLLPVEGNISINLNGHFLTINEDVFEIGNGLNLCVMDFVNSGEIRGTIQVRTEGILNVYSGYISAIETENGTLNIQGGRVGSVIAAGPVNVARQAVIDQLTPVATNDLALGDILTVTGNYTGSVGLKLNTAPTEGVDLGNSANASIPLGSLYLIDDTNMSVVVNGTQLILQGKNICEQCGIEVFWQPLNQSDFDAMGSHGLVPGHYALGEDVSPAQQSLNKDGTKAGTYCLDLAGYTMSGSSRAFLLYSGAVLNVMDSVGGGIIEGQTTSAAAGGVLYAYAGSSFHLYGGTMRFNTASSNVILSGGIIQMYGDFYLHGGCLDGGNVSSYGGTIYVGKGGSFRASGGQILAGRATKGGNCVYVAKNASVFLSDAAQVEEIYFADSSADALTIEGRYTGSVSLKYPQSMVLDDLTDVGNAIGADASLANIEFTDAPGKTVAVKENDLVVSDLPYSYGNCEACGECQWLPITDQELDTIGKYDLNPGHYVLTENVTVSQQQLNHNGDRPGIFCFDLKGHTITGSTRAFLVCQGASLNIMDTVGGGVVEGQGTAAVWGGAVYQYENTNVSLYGGTIRHNTARTETVTNGGAVCVKGGTFYLYGGKIEGAKVTGKGGAIYVDANNGVYGSLIATGGIVTNGTAEGTGDCIYVAKRCAATLTGDAQLAQLTFADSSADVLTLNGKFAGRVELQYPSSLVLIDGMILARVSPDGDLSDGSISIAGTQCQTLQTQDGLLKIADSHEWERVTQAPTCTADGWCTQTCTVCGQVKTTVLVANGHDYESVTTEATCTLEGTIVETCAACHDVQTSIISAKGHSYESDTVSATCTTDGSITITCAECGESKFAIISATGHSYENGLCLTCGEKDPDYVTIPTLTLKAPTLEFKDMICVVAFYTAENIEDVVEMGMLTYKNQVSQWSVETADYVIPGAEYDSASGRYFSSSQGIHAKYLADDVYLACYAKLTDGSYVYTKLAPYSPITYAKNQLKNASNVQLKQLVAAMLNYGAAAQTYFGYHTEDLANADMTQEQQALPERYREDMVQAVPTASAEKQGIFANNKGFSVRKPAISFEGAFCINYFFTPAYAPADGIVLYYWNEADYEAVEVLKMENASGCIQLEGTGTGQYRGDLEGISAKNLSQAVYVAAVYSDGTNTWSSGVLGYSIGTYCSSQASKGGDVAELAMATAVYGYHAKLYFG